jgi:hypothetical protein
VTSIKAAAASAAAAAVQDDILARELGPRFNWLENKIYNSMNARNVVKIISESPPTKIPDSNKMIGDSPPLETTRFASQLTVLTHTHTL